MKSSDENISANDYEQAAIVAQIAGDELLARLEFVEVQPKSILNVGCRTGEFTRKLAAKFPLATIVSVDHAYPMLEFIPSQASSFKICADALQLPFENFAFDLVFANLVLPWCDDQAIALQEWKRVLKPEGLLLFSSLGPDTLRGWHTQFAQHLLPNLIDMHEVGDILTRLRLQNAVMDVDYFTLRYKDINKLLSELILTQMINPISSSELNAELTTVYEIVYGHAFRPDPINDQVADADGVVKIPLSQLRRAF